LTSGPPPKADSAQVSNPIIVALDLPDGPRALDLAKAVRPHVGAYKVGKELFVAEGPALVREIAALERGVFLDLKFHDIPNTVAGAVASAVRLGVSMLTVHAAGGRAMMEAARQAAETTAANLGRPAPLILAVTVLTSMDSASLAEIGVPHPVEDQVERLALLAAAAGLRGLVCSAQEAPRLRKLLPTDFQLVTPGIRLPTDAVGDQKRVLGPREAIAAGSTWLVVGRPIYAAADPVEAARTFAMLAGAS
jgi:orotidine-5'-phosphate decarboxylase